MNSSKNITAVVSICSNNYFPYVRVLFNSLKKYHPEIALFLCLADKLEPDNELGIEGVEIIAADSLGIDNFNDFVFRYDIMELNTAVKPFVMKMLIEEKKFDPVIYLDPDIELFAPLKPILEALENNNFVITPHITSPAECKEYPNDIGIMKAGIYNLGFIALNNSQDSINFLEWWCRRLRFQCINQQDEGIFVDQKFIDLLPAFSDKVAILRDPCVNVAYWNLWQRNLTQTETGWLVNNRPLIFFHFSGIIPEEPYRLSKHTERFNDNLPSPLQSLVDRYIEQLKQFGYGNKEKPPYNYGTFDNGIFIAEIMRRCYRDLEQSYTENPFTDFYKYLNQASGLVSKVSPWKVTNLMYYLWQKRIDLQIAFDLNHLQGRLNYALWFAKHLPEYNIDEYFLQPISNSIDTESYRYKIILLLTKILGKTTWKMRQFLKFSLWLPRKIKKPLKLIYKSFTS